MGWDDDDDEFGVLFGLLIYLPHSSMFALEGTSSSHRYPSIELNTGPETQFHSFITVCT